MSKPWNFLVYIAADNPLYDFAQVSLRQIMDASRFTKIKILVQFDGPSAEFATRYSCADGGKRVLWEAPDGYTPDRGQRLTDFLDFAIEKGFAGQQAPEDQRIFLVLWGHGAGLDHVYLYSDPQDKLTNVPEPEGHQVRERTKSDGAPDPENVGDARGDSATANAFDILNSDDAHANRYLSDMRLADILANFSHRLGHKIDVLGFDACLMGLAEIFHQLAPSVAMSVASDEELPKGSWPYDSILGDLTRFPGMDACTLSAVIVSRFIERYTDEQKKSRISLSTFNLTACEAFAGAMTDFVKSLIAELGDGIVRRKILHARDFSRTPDVPDYIDLGVFCSEVKASFKQNSPVSYWANYVLEMLLEIPYIVYHRDAGENGSIEPLGLAIYFPQALPPTSTEVENYAQLAKDRFVHQPMSGSAGHQVPQGLNSYRPPQGAQPVSIAGGGKTVGGKKTVGGHKDINARLRKELASGRIVQRELLGSEVLWDLYLDLEFNKITKWGELVEALIGSKPATRGANPAR